MIEMQQKLVQKQQLSQQQIQSLQLLTMTNQELLSFCMEEQLSNPTLEFDNAQTSTYSGEKTNTDLYVREEGCLKDFLIPQLDTTKLTTLEHQICSFIIACLSENGYLEIPPLEISYLTKQPLPLVQKCINIIQSLEPAGIGANSLTHCLLLQLERLGIIDPIFEEVVKYHLEALSEGSINKVALNLHIKPEQVKHYVQILRSLSPIPANGFSQETTQYITPDILFYLEEGEKFAVLCDEWIHNLTISPLYHSLSRFKEDKEVYTYIQDALKRGENLLSAIEKRHTTLSTIVEFLLLHQHEHLFNNAPLKPLTMKELATELNIAPSTITRAISGKYYQSPCHTDLLRNLFVQSSTEEGKDKEQVKARLVALIKEETTPLSDEELEERLNGEGFSIKRRTIAKYRDALNIPTAKQRKLQKIKIASQSNL